MGLRGRRHSKDGWSLKKLWVAVVVVEDRIHHALLLCTYQSAYVLRIDMICVMCGVQVEAPKTAQNDVKSKASFLNAIKMIVHNRQTGPASVQHSPNLMIIGETYR